MNVETTSKRASERGAELALLSAMRRGEVDAGAAMYRAVAPAVFNAVWRMVRGSDADLQDVAQTTFEVFFRTMCNGTFEGRCSLARWAGLIAARVATDHYRKQERARSLVTTGDTVEQPAASDLEAALVARSELQRLERVLARMKSIDTSILLLHFGHGYSLAETAEKVGVSEVATVSRILRARKRLRRAAHTGNRLASDFLATGS